jgi:hypothetical protein
MVDFTSPITQIHIELFLMLSFPIQLVLFVVFGNTLGNILGTLRTHWEN